MAVRGRPYKKGENGGARGGKRPGSGRKPEWFKKQMAQIASSPAAVKFLKGVVENKDVDEFLVLQTGVQVPVKADGDLKLKVLNYCASYGFGKPNQALELSGQVDSRLIFVFEDGDTKSNED